MSENEIELINVVNEVKNTLLDRKFLNSPVAALVVILLLFPSLIDVQLVNNSAQILPKYC